MAPGFDAGDVVSADLTPDRVVCEAPEQCGAFYDRAIEGLGAFPGVTSVGLGSQQPIGGPDAAVRTRRAGPSRRAWRSGLTAMRVVASAGYFDALDLRVRRGRPLTDADRSSAHQVTVINEAFARRFWPGVDPVGKRIRYVWQPTWRTVVGVVPDVRHSGLAAPAPLAFYVPYGQESPRNLTIVVESSQPSAIVTRQVRAAGSECRRAGQQSRPTLSPG